MPTAVVESQGEEGRYQTEIGVGVHLKTISSVDAVVKEVDLLYGKVLYFATIEEDRRSVGINLNPSNIMRNIERFKKGSRIEIIAYGNHPESVLQSAAERVGRCFEAE